LNVFDLLRFRPISDSFDFVGGHSQTAGGEEVSKVFNRGGMEFALLWFSIQSMLPESTEYLMDVLLIDYDTDIKHISEDGINETLESCRSPLIGAIAGAEGSLPFISGCDVDKMVGVPEIDLGIDFTTARGVKEVRDEREWVAVFLRDFVESLEVDTESE
ncbi:hypothetical protein PAXRUDRAFT_163097, partial [Paxillus rubicundulus Ve08.2h10]